MMMEDRFFFYCTKIKHIKDVSRVSTIYFGCKIYIRLEDYKNFIFLMFGTKII